MVAILTIMLLSCVLSDWATAIVALIGLVLGYLSVRLSYLSFKEAANVRKDIARSGFVQKQEICVAKLAKYLNHQDLRFTSANDQKDKIFCGNIWAILKSTTINSYKDYCIVLSRESYTVLEVDNYLYDVYLPQTVATSLRNLVEGSNITDIDSIKYIVLQTCFDTMDKYKMPYDKLGDTSLYSTKIVVNDFVQNAQKLRKAIEEWYKINGIEMTFNLIEIDKTKL